jgi:hypothetical protein
MAGIESFLKGWVSRILPQPETDNDPGIVRLGRYGDVWTVGVVRKQHALADEGSYFVANNSGTGVATTATPTAFSDTAPLLTIQNTDTAGQNTKRIHVDWIRLTQTAAGTGGVDMRFKVVLDTTTPSSGTVLTPVNPNMDSPKSASVASVRLLGTGVTQSGNSRVVVGTLIGIPAMTAPIAVLSEVFLSFGGVEGYNPITNLAASANPYRGAYNLPPVVLGAQQCMMLEFLITSQSAASSWAAEIGWWER